MPLLGARFLTGVCSVNSFDYADRAQLTEGDTAQVYLQLVDRLRDLPSAGFQPPFRRYVPAAGATLTVTLTSLDDARVVVKTATQPFVGDASIWTFATSATDGLRGTVNVRLQLNQGGSLLYALLQPGLSAQPKQ